MENFIEKLSDLAASLYEAAEDSFSIGMTWSHHGWRFNAKGENGGAQLEIDISHLEGLYSVRVSLGSKEDYRQSTLVYQKQVENFDEVYRIVSDFAEDLEILSKGREGWGEYDFADKLIETGFIHKLEEAVSGED